MVAPVRWATPGIEVDCAEIAAVLREVDDPVGQHAAALATEREDRDGDRPDFCNAGVHSALTEESVPPSVPSPLVFSNLGSPRWKLIADGS